MRSWRYYLNISLYYITMFLMVFAAGRALRQPSFWIVTAALLVVHQAVRSAFRFAHPWRRISLDESQLRDFKNITYEGADGIRLFARFAPSRNQGTILLVHGLSSSGRDLEVLARLLMRAGFGIFLPDLRAHGDSQGDTSTWGMKEGEDIACAVQYLLKRVDVNGEKIGAYGLSLGAQAVLRGALRTAHIKALVLEGLGPGNLSDYGMPKEIKQWISLAADWLHFAAYQLMSGTRQHGVLQVIKEISPRPIFFIASGAKDIYFSRLFYAASREPKQLWEVPAAAHGGAIAQDPNQYLDRMIEFFSRSLSIQGGIR